MQSIEDLLFYNSEKTIYHYTSPQGLLDILNSGKLWFTESNCLNDESEGSYIFDLIEKVLLEYKDNDYVENVKSWIKKERIYGKELNEDFRELDTNVISENRKYFICCFSKNIDSFPLWKNYTKNNFSIGYNLGFSPKKLLESINTYWMQYCTSCIKMYEVVYEENRQLSIIRKILDGYYEKWKDNKRERFTLLSFLIDTLKFAFKHPAFKDEEEVRLVLSLDVSELKSFLKGKKPDNGNCEESLEMKLRIVKDFYAPYLELPFMFDEIETIGVSPTVKDNQAIQSIEYVKKKYGLTCQVKKSEIPVRF